MKYQRFLQSVSAILLLVFATTPLLAQDFLPLKTGNAWCYEINLPTPHYSTITVLGDTTMPNGRTYARLSQRDLVGAQFVRADSAFISYYSEGDSLDVSMYNLESTASSVDSIRWFDGSLLVSMMAYVDTLQYFGKSTVIRHYGLGGLIAYNVAFGKELGVVQAEYFGDSDPASIHNIWTLSGAIIDDTTYGTMVGVPEERTVPERFPLHQNYPNPFNPSTSISFELPKRMHVTLDVYDMLGREVRRLVDETQNAGEHTIRFDGARLASGVYLYRLHADNTTTVKKMTLLR